MLGTEVIDSHRKEVDVVDVVDVPKSFQRDTAKGAGNMFPWVSHGLTLTCSNLLF